MNTCVCIICVENISPRNILNYKPQPPCLSKTFQTYITPPQAWMKAAVWQSRAVWRTSQASPPSGVHSPDFTIPSIALYYPDFAIPYPLYYPDFTIPSVLSRFYHTIPSALSRCYHTKPMHFAHHTTPRQKLARASQVPSMVRHGVPSPDQNVCGCQKYLTSLVGVNKRSILYFCVN